MDTTLVTVTLLSMGMAAALSVIVWRMLRDERQRSEARIAQLAIASGTAREPRQSPSNKDRGASGARNPQSGAAPVSDLMLRDDRVAAPDLFAEPQQSSPWGRRLAVIAGLALVLATGVLLMLTVRDRTGAQARSATAVGAGGGAPQGATTASTIGLELLSLRDTRQPASLTITGLVQNPRGGALLSQVTVTAYAFDDKGSFLASGRAPIEVTALAPGDESPFVVSVPVTDAVARYRIGFRGEDGRVIAHIDKRQPAPVAVNW